jgi:7-cyano-7-deazaguanine synthase
MKTIVVFSGGLDSTTLLYHMRSVAADVKALTVNYNQRHVKEIEYAKNMCDSLGVEHRIIDIPGLQGVLGGNALTNTQADIPEGEYQDQTIKITTVPNRNMILLSVAIAWASALKFNSVAFGAHAGEHTNYPDCKDVFSKAMDAAARVCDWEPITVLSPFVNWNKGDIVKRGIELRVPFERTWSCYNGRDLHCGKCSTCMDRLQAFRQAGISDPAEYEVG